jgi:hypothetical protein
MLAIRSPRVNLHGPVTQEEPMTITGSRNRIPPLLVALVLCGLQSPLRAQPEVASSVVASGGDRIAGPTYSVVGTIGQPATGVVTGSGRRHEVGFWYQPDRIIVGVGAPELPTAARFGLRHGYPNPFNPTTTIEFSLARRTPVRLELFDASGRRVRGLVDGELEAGEHRIRLGTEGLASGVYYCRMTAAEFSDTISLVLVK